MYGIQITGMQMINEEGEKILDEVWKDSNGAKWVTKSASEGRFIIGFDCNIIAEDYYMSSISFLLNEVAFMTLALNAPVTLNGAGYVIVRW